MLSDMNLFMQVVTVLGVGLVLFGTPAAAVAVFANVLMNRSEKRSADEANTYRLGRIATLESLHLPHDEAGNAIDLRTNQTMALGEAIEFYHSLLGCSCPSGKGCRTGEAMFPVLGRPYLGVSGEIHYTTTESYLNVLLSKDANPELATTNTL